MIPVEIILKTFTKEHNWPEDHIDKLQDLFFPSYNVRNHVDEVPNLLSIENASIIFNKLLENDYIPDAIICTVDGGVGIAFAKNNWYAEVECENDGEIWLSYNYRTEDPYIIELTKENQES